MTSPRLVVSVVDLDQGPKRVSFTIPLGWLRDMLEPAGASPRGEGQLSVEVTQQGHDVMVRGHASFGVTMPCVVTLDPVDYDLRSEIFLLLKPGKSKPHAPPRAGAAPPGSTAKSTESRLPKKKKRPPKHESEPADEEAVRDTYEGDEVVLDEFVREFLLLELPLYPRRPDLPSAEESLVSRPLAGPTGEKPIDPRLEPLAKLAERLRGAANKE